MQEPFVRPGLSACRYCELERFEEPVASSEAGFSVPSYGAMVEGWTIVFPRTHVLALADLDDAEWRAYSVLLATTRRKVEALYGPSVLFEHGSAGTGRPAGCGVDHAHMHIAPLDIALVDAITPLLPGEEASWLPAGDRVVSRADMDYIYVDDASGRWVIYRSWLPSQVARKAIASHLGHESWDWKRSPNIPIVEATRTAIRAAA